MKKLLMLMICVALLTSCTAADNGGNGGIWGREEGKARLPECADYGTGDAAYTVEIRDGKRSVTLDAKREGGITVATVTSPEELAGAVITDDTEGMRMILDGGCELPLSAEVSAGLAAVFAVYLPLPEDVSVTDEGEAEFMAGDYTIRLALTEDGYPDMAVLAKDGAEREVMFTTEQVGN